MAAIDCNMLWLNKIWKYLLCKIDKILHLWIISLFKKEKARNDYEWFSKKVPCSCPVCLLCGKILGKIIKTTWTLIKTIRRINFQFWFKFKYIIIYHNSFLINLWQITSCLQTNFEVCQNIRDRWHASLVEQVPWYSLPFSKYCSTLWKLGIFFLLGEVISLNNFKIKKGKSTPHPKIYGICIFNNKHINLMILIIKG